ncbi:MAG TPA: cytochrome c maturation protein CcmE [Acidimicrobiales bacterium]|jgi:cytochrome c-type biogenesis protein CcmE
MDVSVPRSESDFTPDAGPEPDLTPRTLGEPEAGARRRRKRNPGAYVLLVLIIGAIGYVIFQGLSSAALYYRNADEAVADKASLGTRRFRVQGTVVDPVTKVGNEVDFTITFNGASVPVHHIGGDPPELFKSGIPVVLEGHWDQSGDFFTSDSILIKHSADYKQQNPDRVASNAP